MTSVAAMALALAGCAGGDEEATQTAASLPETTAQEIRPSTEGVPPTASRLVGTWSRTGERLLVRFSADSTFALDTADPDYPYAAGEYEVDGRTISFTSHGPQCADTWAWEAGLTEGEDRLDDELHIVLVEEGCGVLAGTAWTFARVTG